MRTQRDDVESERAKHDARRMFQRVLASWACDLMTLRARGLEKPTRRVCNAGLTVRKAA